MTEQHIGSFRVVCQIGQGGMGAVYEALDTVSGQRVALKVLQQRFSQDSDLVTRFLNEARAAGAIRHPGIVRVYASGQLDDGTCYIAMERLPGESLSARLKRHRGRLGLPAVALIQQAAAALAAAHDKRIYHRDLKPSNLMLVPDPARPGGEGVKIIDFGIAKLPIEEQGEGAEFHTRTGAMIGTPIYMSPEQCRGVAVTDRTDVYSLAVVLFHALCGRPPFFSSADGDMLAMHILVAPPLLRDLAPEMPADLAALIGRMLAKAPEDRPTMAEVAGALAQIAAQLPASTTDPAAPLRPSGLPTAPHLTVDDATVEHTSERSDRAAFAAAAPEPATVAPEYLTSQLSSHLAAPDLAGSAPDERPVADLPDGIGDQPTWTPSAGATPTPSGATHRRAPWRRALRQPGLVVAAAAVMVLLAVAGAVAVRLGGQRAQSPPAPVGAQRAATRLARPDVTDTASATVTAAAPAPGAEEPQPAPKARDRGRPQRPAHGGRALTREERREDRHKPADVVPDFKKM